MKQKAIASLRKSYQKNSLLESSIADHPMDQFSIWFNSNLKINTQEANAMVLSTADKNNKPSSRIVLLKGFGLEEGFRFYTNYESRKGQELKKNPNASLLFYWPDQERQIRIEGKVKKLNKKESEAYFHSRPRGSQLGAWSSEQSAVIPNRQFLDDVQRELDEYFKPYKNLPLPPFWGGYTLIPDYFEFWQGREDRLHDRIVYRLYRKKWNISRLAP